MRRSGIACLSSLFLVCAAALPALAQVAPIGTPFEIAPAEGSHTSPPLLAARPDGSYLVVWTTQLPTGKVMYGQLLGPSGTPIGPQLLLGGGAISDVSVAVSPDGGFVVAWEQDREVLVTACDRDGRPRIFAVPAAPADPILERTEPGVAVGADGEWMVVWREVELPPTGWDVRIVGRRFGPDGTPTSDPARLNDQTYDELSDPEVAAAPGGGFLAVWALDWEPNITPIGETSNYVTRPIDADGNLGLSTELSWGKEESWLARLPGDRGFLLAQLGSDLLYSQRLDLQGKGLPWDLSWRMLPQFDLKQSIAIDPAGRLLLVGTDKYPAGLYTRLFDADHLTPQGDVVPLQSAKPLLKQPYLASASPGQFLMVWEDQGRWLGEVLAVGCTAPHLGLCLAQSRVRVEVSWRDHQGNTGQGRAVPLKDDTGSFWFFTPSNVELLVKVLDGRNVNHHFWVFYGSLSDVEYDIRVTDTQTGDVQVYHNPSGTLASHADVLAFPPNPGTDPPAFSIAGAANPGPIRQAIAPLSPPIYCHSSAEALCLDPLYRVTIDFIDPQTGATRHARAVPFSQESGAFWFFDPDNLELFVKVLDGSAVNGHTWVFYGGLTDVEYTLRVEDLLGEVWTYHNPRGRMSSGADTSALPPPVQF